MAYVVYDRGLYVTGFRPAGTNPQAATQMAGIFSAQHLHGYPFSDAGGYMLHGLGAMVEDQAIVSYQGRWPLADKNAQDVLAQVAGALGQDGLSVRSLTSDAGFIASSQGNILARVPFVGQSTFNVKLQVQVENGMGFGDPNDIISIIRHEVYVATGQFPLSDSITAIQHVPGGTVEQTGEPGVDAAAQAPAQDWGAWLQQNAWWVAAAAVGVFVVPKILGR